MTTTKRRTDMRPSYVVCDGCHQEVHDDTVRIVGDQVLCDRCRKPDTPKMPFWFRHAEIKFGGKKVA